MAKRVLVLSLLFILLVCLSFYGKYHHPWLNLQTCLNNPQGYDGHLITSYSEPQIGQLYDNGFQLNQKHLPSIRVLADTSGLIEGEYVGLTAIFHEDGYLTATSIHVAHRRRYKIWVSVIPVLLVGLVLIRNFRFDRKRFLIGLRNDA